MKKKLVALFKTSGGGSQTWSYNEPGEGKSSEEIKEILQQMTSLTLFYKENEKLFNEVTSAKYVETIETIIF